MRATIRLPSADLVGRGCRRTGCLPCARRARAPRAACARCAASDTDSRRSGRADGSASRRSPRRGSRSRTPARCPVAPSGRRCGGARHRRRGGHGVGSSSANEPVWLLEKQITSQRPCPGARRSRSPSVSRQVERRAHPHPTGSGIGSRRRRRRSPAQGPRWLSPDGPGTAGTGRRRLVGAVLAQRRDDHPLSGLSVETHLRLLLSVARAAADGRRPARAYVPGQREEQQIAAVGQRPPQRWVVHVAHRSPTLGDHQVADLRRDDARSASVKPSSTMRVSTCAAGRTRWCRPRRTSCDRPAPSAARRSRSVSDSSAPRRYWVSSGRHPDRSRARRDRWRPPGTTRSRRRRPARRAHPTGCARHR